MLRVAPGKRQPLRDAFLPDRPGPLAGLHTIGSGYGELWIDRRPDPRVIVARGGMDYQLAGDANALTPDMLRSLELAGTVDASPAFARVLREAYPELDTMERVIQEIRTRLPTPPAEGFVVRKLDIGDAPALDALEPDLRWIFKPYDGARGAAESPGAYGAFDAHDRLASVALPFHRGVRYEDVGIVTQSWARRRGAGLACAARVVDDVLSRGRTVSWSTSPDNAGSLAVASRLGAQHVRDDVLYIVNWPDDM